MDLAELIERLRNIGNQFSSWYGIETNIKSVVLTDDYKVIVKLNDYGKRKSSKR